MAQQGNDGTLVRGSIRIGALPLVLGGTASVVLLNYKRSAKARQELDYDEYGKPLASNNVEDFEKISGDIRMRSDQGTPAKFVPFSFDGKNWQIVDREESGSTEGIKVWSVDLLEVVNPTITIS